MVLCAVCFAKTGGVCLSISDIIYRNRQTDDMISEKMMAPKLQGLMAGSRLVWRLFDFFMNRSWCCWLYGKWQDRSASRKNIGLFVATHHIDVDEIELPLSQYTNFNAFFSRRLKSDARPFNLDPKVFCAPADGKVFVYAQLHERTLLPIKNAYVNIAELLASDFCAEPYHGGSALVVRLAPYDYHRFHFAESGMAEQAQEIDGRYYPVNPPALVHKPDLFAHNKRTITYLNTEQFGRIAYMEVAGYAVGRIVQCYESGGVIRGQEKGYFQFGGSTLVLLFEPGVILFDEDLIRDTKAGVEVQVQTGTQIGVEA